MNDRRNPDSIVETSKWGCVACGLKNDALMEEPFMRIVGEHYQADEDYAIYVFHDRYDIPAKGLDHIRQGESERMYEYILCVICVEWGIRTGRTTMWISVSGIRRRRCGDELCGYLSGRRRISA